MKRKIILNRITKDASKKWIMREEFATEYDNYYNLPNENVIHKNIIGYGGLYYAPTIDEVKQQVIKAINIDIQDYQDKINKLLAEIDEINNLTIT